MVYRVKEAFKVKAYAVFITLGDIFLRPLQCLVAATVRAETKAVVVELAFINGTQDLADGLLDYPVYHRRDTKRTALAVILRYFYTEDGGSDGICPISRMLRVLLCVFSDNLLIPRLTIRLLHHRRDYA